MKDNRLILICIYCLVLSFMLGRCTAPKEIQVKKEIVHKKQENLTIKETIKKSKNQLGNEEITIDRIIEAETKTQLTSKEDKKELIGNKDYHYILSGIATLEGSKLNYGASLMMKIPALPVYVGGGYIFKNSNGLFIQAGVLF